MYDKYVAQRMKSRYYNTFYYIKKCYSIEIEFVEFVYFIRQKVSYITFHYSTIHMLRRQSWMRLLHRV